MEYASVQKSGSLGPNGNTEFICFYVTGITKKKLRWHFPYNKTKNLMMLVRIIFWHNLILKLDNSMRQTLSYHTVALITFFN